MTALAPMQSSFNAGELGARLGGRPDTAAYQNGASEMVNVVPVVQGPALKRSGTRLVQLAKAQASAGWLIPFEASVTQAYVIEASAAAFRFYTNNGRIETAGVPFEVATPYATVDLPGLDWQQSNDVLYLVDGKRVPQKLSRTSATTFSIAALALAGGPFADQNTDRTITVYASAGTGSVTLTAAAAIFLAGHVGALFYLELVDFRDIAQWEPGISTTVGALRRNEGHVYKAITLPAAAARTGTVAPVHLEGRERDGMGSGLDINAKDAGGVLWEYQYGRYGIARITAVATGTSATATVVTTLPDNVVGAANASWRWALPALSDATGWPGSVAIWNQRLTFGTGNMINTGVVGDYANFAARNDQGELTADQGLSYRLPGADPIQWLSADRQLLAGTLRAEYALGPSQAQLAVSATNINAPTQSFYGSAKVRPAKAANKTLFVQRAGRKLRELGYDFNADRYAAPDLTTRHPKVTEGGIVQLAVQSEPEGIVWAVRADGTLLSFTYSPEQEVKGWSRHVLGGWSDAARSVPAAVESIAVIPSPDGTADDLWLLVRRWVGGATGGPLRTVERLDPFWREGTAVADGFFVDCGLTYRGPAVATLGGLAHLVGETVTLLVDGATHPDLVVAPGGTVTLANGITGSTIHAGLRFTARVTTMRIDAAGGGGSIAGKLKRIVNLTLRLLETMGITTGVPGGRLDQILSRKPADAMDTAVPLFSGDRRKGFPGGWERDGFVTVESRDPLPMTLLALMPEAEGSNG